MTPRDSPSRPAAGPRREFPFAPRLINPIKIRDVVVLAGAESIRAAPALVQAEVPWVRFHVLAGPAALLSMKADRPTLLLLDDVAANVVDVPGLRHRHPELVIALLSAYRLVQCSPPSVARAEFPYTAQADLVFAANETDCAPLRILAAVIRSAEDHLNIERCPGVGRFIFLLVDDEPRWFSEFLPVLYQIIGQRADVKLTRTYGEALRFLFGAEAPGVPPGLGACGHGDDVVCLITDIYFPTDDGTEREAGRDLIQLVKTRLPRIPIIIASKAEGVDSLTAGFVLPKGDPGSLGLLATYVRDRTGVGDFVVHDEAGVELYRLKDVREIYRLMRRAGGPGPDRERLRAILSRCAAQDRFSTWLYMHGFRDLADRLRPERLSGERLVRVLERLLEREILRMRRTPLVVDGTKIRNLPELADALRAPSAEKFEDVGDNDVISSWLDQQGYSELADELRPLHGRGPEFRHKVAASVERWLRTYGERDAGLDRAEII